MWVKNAITSIQLSIKLLKSMLELSQITLHCANTTIANHVYTLNTVNNQVTKSNRKRKLIIKLKVSWFIPFFFLFVSLCCCCVFIAFYVRYIRNVFICNHGVVSRYYSVSLVVTILFSIIKHFCFQHFEQQFLFFSSVLYHVKT